MRNEPIPAPRGKVLITGASGFVGRHLVEEYARNGWEIRAVVRSLATCNLDRTKVSEIVEVPDIAEVLDWAPLVHGCSVVAHLAARAHQVQEAQDDGVVAFHRVNVAATANLALVAANANVRRFLFVSSSGVMGDASQKPWTEDDVPNPQSAYAKSKLMAEQKVQSIAFQSDMEYVILRPALVYGPGNPGNLARLIKLVGTGLPLPFKGIAGKRSMVNVNYLVQILIAASTLREATNQTYLVADGQDLTLSSIVQAFAEGLNVPVRLFNCPLSMLSLISNLVGKTAELQKLMGTFQISPQKLQCDFGIAPFLGAKESLAMTANSFRREINNG